MKFCKRCHENRDTNSNYCSRCGQHLDEKDEKSISIYDVETPRGCTTDYMGHVRPDMDYQRQIRDSYRDRW